MVLGKSFPLLMVLTGCFLVTLLLVCVRPARLESSTTTRSPRTTLSVRSTEPILPIPTAITKDDTEKVALGQRLFHDPVLSKDDTISCSSCHSLRTAGVDGRVRSLGIHQQVGNRNAPTVFNAGFNYRQFWDGRVHSLEEQVTAPVQAKGEMGTDWQEITTKLRKDPGYQAAFRQLYPDGICPDNVKDAIATFERTLTTPDSPFDCYLKGQRNAISHRAAHGYALFKSYGCVSCHQGVNVGGNMMQPFGVMIDPALIRERVLQKDTRLLTLTEMGDDTHRRNVLYKVPGLRNVARTAPYFHDGSATDLSEAVRIMALSQLGRRLPDSDVDALIAFLNSLTGKYQGQTL